MGVSLGWGEEAGAAKRGKRGSVIGMQNELKYSFKKVCTLQPEYPDSLLADP